MEMFNKNIPTVFVILGGTGDLMRRKIVPALFYLYKQKQLPKLFHVIGVARKNLSDKDFQKEVGEMLKKHVNMKKDKKILEEFLHFFTYHQGDFNNKKTFKDLAKNLGNIDGVWKTCSNKLFYFSVYPEYYNTIVSNMAEADLHTPCSYETGWTRVIVEKPFGRDLRSSQAINKCLRKYFKEEQIYRIDHYLGKEMIQDILSFRFSNTLFSKEWTNESIESIHISLWEDIGVEERGSFYETVGAFRDVGQNHLLSLLAILTMKHPVTFNAKSIREKRECILNSLKKMSKHDIQEHTYRAQYDGYTKIDGVKKNSSIETYFKIRTFLSIPEYDRIPIILESGKRLSKKKKEIVITFKHPMPCFVCGTKMSEYYKNKIIISWEPIEGITIRFWSKKPGFDYELEQRMFNFTYRDKSKKIKYVEEYAKLLFDCIHGDQTLFSTQKEIEAMWRFTDPIIQAWNNNIVPLHMYKAGSDTPSKDSEHIEAPELLEVHMKKELAVVGLGKMGANIARQLLEKGWKVVGYNRTISVAQSMQAEGLIAAKTLKEAVKKLSSPRIIYLMVPAGKPVEDLLFGPDGLIHSLKKGDIIIDSGNSFYKDTVRRYKELDKKGIHYVDIGFSGGPSGARNGGCLMVGGKESIFKKIEPLIHDLSLDHGYQFFKGSGAGHFVKMIHNGIEYGMMQSLAEGFHVMKESSYNLNLSRVADVYNHGSVIQSRLLGWLLDGFNMYTQDLKGVSGSVPQSGEGMWTVNTAKDMKLVTKVIEDAVKFRLNSKDHPNYAGKILSTLRNQFGGHPVK